MPPRRELPVSHPLRSVLLRGSNGHAAGPRLHQSEGVLTGPRHVRRCRCATACAPLTRSDLVVPLRPCSSAGTEGNSVMRRHQCEQCCPSGELPTAAIAHRRSFLPPLRPEQGWKETTNCPGTQRSTVRRAAEARDMTRSFSGRGPAAREGHSAGGARTTRTRGVTLAPAEQDGVQRATDAGRDRGVLFPASQHGGAGIPTR